MSGTHPQFKAHKWAIEKIKADHGLRTDEDLAAALHISRKTLSRIKSGAPVRYDFIAGMLVRFGVAFADPTMYRRLDDEQTPAEH